MESIGRDSDIRLIAYVGRWAGSVNPTSGAYRCGSASFNLLSRHLSAQLLTENPLLNNLMVNILEKFIELLRYHLVST